MKLSGQRIAQHDGGDRIEQAYRIGQIQSVGKLFAQHQGRVVGFPVAAHGDFIHTQFVAEFFGDAAAFLQSV